MDTAAHNGRRFGGHYYREFNMLNKEEYRVFMEMEETHPSVADVLRDGIQGGAKHRGETRVCHFHCDVGASIGPGLPRSPVLRGHLDRVS